MNTMMMSLSIMILSVQLLTSQVYLPKNKNISNAYDIANADEEKVVEAALVTGQIARSIPTSPSRACKTFTTRSIFWVRKFNLAN